MRNAFCFLTLANDTFNLSLGAFFLNTITPEFSSSDGKYVGLMQSSINDDTPTSFVTTEEFQ